MNTFGHYHLKEIMKNSWLCFLFLFSTIRLFGQQSGYYALEGKLGERTAVLELAVRPDTALESMEEMIPVTGYYYFDDECLPIELYRDNLADTTHFVLRPWGETEDPESFIGVFNGQSYEGKWAKGTDTLDFRLHLTNRAGTEQFRYSSRYKTVEVTAEKLAEPVQGKITFSVFLPKDKQLANQFFQLLTDGKYGDFEQYSTAEIQDFEKNYRKDAKEMLQDMDVNFAYTLNYVYNHNSYPVLNTADYLIMASSFYQYTGGAHGMSAEQFYTYSKKDKKWLQLGDILDTSKEQEINAALDAELRDQYDLEDGVKLSEANDTFLADSIHYTANFTLSKRGITFHYGLYELTPYAYGYFELLVPYERLKPFFRPGFTPFSDSEW